MKKYLLCLLLIVSLLIAGCGKKDEVIEDDNTKFNPDDTVFTINGLEFRLDTEREYEGIKYTIASEFEERKLIGCVQYQYYQEEGPNLLFYRIFYYAGKSFEQARDDLGIDSSLKVIDGKTDKIAYKLVDDSDDKGTIHFYFVTKDGNTYAIQIASMYDIEEFETKVLKTIHF